MMILAQITRDSLYAPLTDELRWDQRNRLFTYDALVAYFNLQNFGLDSKPPVELFKEAPRVNFRLYDDDDILYYEGWLLNDDQCMVQQFVLEWARSYAGATEIKVKQNRRWVTEIG